jgi:hypothetical protein
MSEFLTIDTTSGVVTEERIEPLKLFDENHPMLSVPIPEYTEAIPNPSMNNLVARLKMTMKLYNVASFKECLLLVQNIFKLLVSIQK